jgi:hypothetical protein
MEVLDTVVAPKKEEINRLVGFAAPIGQTHCLSICTSMIWTTATTTTSTTLGNSRQTFSTAQLEDELVFKGEKDVMGYNSVAGRARPRPDHPPSGAD